MGNALQDTIVRIPDDALLETLALLKGGMTPVGFETLGAAFEATKGLQWMQTAGGSAANAIRGIAQLGMGTGFIGKVGRDDEGDRVSTAMREVGISAMLRKSVARTGQVLALVSPDATRTFATFLGAAATLNAADLSASDFAGYDIFHLEGYIVQNRTLLSRALSFARDAMHTVSLDLANYSIIDTNREFLHRVLPAHIDILLANVAEARAFTGRAPEEAMAELSRMCRVVVVKMGRDGAMAQSGEEVAHVAGRNIVSVDNTGAGDFFASGFLYGYASGWSLGKALELGSYMAEEVIQVLGTHIAEESWRDIRAMAARIAG